MGQSALRMIQPHRQYEEQWLVAEESPVEKRLLPGQVTLELVPLGMPVVLGEFPGADHVEDRHAAGPGGPVQRAGHRGVGPGRPRRRGSTRPPRTPPSGRPSSERVPRTLTTTSTAARGCGLAFGYRASATSSPRASAHRMVSRRSASLTVRATWPPEAARLQMTVRLVRAPGQRRDRHVVTGPHPGHDERQMERRGAGTEGECARRTDEPGELLLERIDVRTKRRDPIAGEGIGYRALLAA